VPLFSDNRVVDTALTLMIIMMLRTCFLELQFS
jgi:hypothetical protein